MTKYPDERLLIIMTGCQGEPGSSLQRMVTQNHQQLEIKPGDMVVLSSPIIPGNEISITRMINQLYRLGATVHSETESTIHVSGHASPRDLKNLANTDIW